MALTYLDSAMIELPATITTLSARNLQATNLTATNLTAANLQVGSITNSTNVIGDLTIYGQLTALSGFNVVIASTTSTSALSVSNIQARPALDVYQGPAHPIISVFKNNTGNNAPATITSRITVDTSGNVGIGTEIPNERLTVVGSISTTGTASMSALNIVSGNVFPKTTFNNLVSALAINVNGTILYMPLLSAI